MLHLLVDERHEHGLSRLHVLDGGTVALIVVARALLGQSEHVAHVDIVERDRLEVAHVFLDGTVFLCLVAAVAHLDALELAYLEEACVGHRVAVHLIAVGIAGGEVDIYLAVGGACLGGYLWVGLVEHGAVGGVLDIVEVGVVVALAASDKLSLLLGCALCGVFLPEAGNLLRELMHSVYVALELLYLYRLVLLPRDVVALLTEHVAEQVGGHFVLLVVVVEAYAERCLQRVEDGLHALFGEVVAVGPHLTDIGREGGAGEGGGDGDRLHFVLTYLHRLHLAAAIKSVFELLHLFRFGVVDGELSSAASRFEPGVGIGHVIE